MHSRFFVVIVFAFVLSGFPQAAFAANPIVLNEVIVHPNAGGKEWVEFYVTDNTDIKTYWIDDDTDFNNDSGGSAKKSLESVLQGNDNQHYFIELSASMFNNSEDSIVLFKSDGTIADQFNYADGPGFDVAMGRSPDGSGSFAYLSNPTRGSPNSGPLPTITPTPEPTAKPTKEPTATREPTEARSSTSTPTSRATASPTPRASSTPRPASPSAKVASRGAFPTAVLGANTVAEPSKISLPSIPIKVKSASSTPAIFTIVGAGFIIACAGVLFWKKFRKT